MSARHLRSFTDADARRLFPVPRADAHKYSRGVVGIDAGSAAFPGAAILACSGAARAGAGMVRYLGPRDVGERVLAARPEAVLGDGRYDILVVGCGLAAEDPRARAGVEALTDADGPLRGRGVIDAGALGAIRAGDRLRATTILTPHAGEARSLAGVLGVDPELPREELVSALAAACGATVLLKGTTTLVADGGDPGHVVRVDRTTPMLATAGTGDVLAGIVGTFLAAGLDAPDAASLGAHVHAAAGLIASRGGLVPLVALDVASRLPDALAAILERAVEPAADQGGA